MDSLTVVIEETFTAIDFGFLFIFILTFICFFWKLHPHLEDINNSRKNCPGSKSLPMGEEIEED